MPVPAFSLAPLGTPSAVSSAVDDVFADPSVRRGMGWTEADDTDEAMQAIHGLFQRRLESGWTLLDVRVEDQRAGLAGVGPVDEDGGAWSAIYLLRRGQGLGARVTQRLVERAREAGASELIAVTWAKNEPAHALLEATGFQRRGLAPYDWARESELDWLEYRRPLDTP